MRLTDRSDSGVEMPRPAAQNAGAALRQATNGGLVDQKAHHIQDALEKYAVAKLQGIAEERGLASMHTADMVMEEFHEYATARELTAEDFTAGTYAGYKANLDRHLPVFMNRLEVHYEGSTLDFEDVEKEYRNNKLKGDFVITIDSDDRVSVSLKNYRNTAATPQVCSGTFNSFILNFLFESQGVGTWIDPMTNAVFSGTPSQRDLALVRNGLEDLVPLMHQIDDLNSAIRARFIDTDEFEFLDEHKFDAARKECGHAGASVCFEILSRVPQELIKSRILKAIGFDGAEEALIIDPVRNVDTITSPAFHALLDGVQSAELAFAVNGQNINFRFVSDNGKDLLTVNVPFTINKNGAWISGEPYEGTRWHKKEERHLAYNQRRPKKSRELATSVNTYVYLQATGIFNEG